MKIRLPILLLSLFVCLRAFGAAPAVSYSAAGFTITVPSGHTVVWVGQASGSSGSVTDADGDGKVVVAPVLRQGVFVFVDVQAGEFTIIYPAGQPLTPQDLPAGTIVRGRNGDFSQLIVSSSSGYASGLWVRPGVGVWTPRNAVLADADQYPYNNLVFYDATAMNPIGSSTPPTPSGFALGDRLIVLPSSGGLPFAGIVDPFLTAPPNGGAISFVLPDLAPVQEGASLSVSLMRTDGTDGTVTVRCRTVGTTADAGVDYVATDQIVSFGPGETLKTVQVATINDALYAAERKQFALVLSDPSGARLGPDVAYEMYVMDNDPYPDVRFGDVPASVLERDAPWTLSVPVLVSGAFRDPLPVYFDVSNDGSPNKITTELLFQPGETRKDASVAIFADDVPSASLSLYLNVGVGSARVTVLDDDAPELRIDDITAVEGTRQARVLVKVAAIPADSASIEWKVVDGTAKADSDFVAVHYSTPITSTTTELVIPLVDDAVREETETFYVDIVNVRGAVSASRTRVMVTLYDDDAPPVAVSIVPLSTSEGAPPSKQVDVRVQLATPSPAGVSLTFVTTGEGTADPGSDYLPTSQAVEFAPGVTERTVRLTIVGDRFDEDDETFAVALMQESTVRATGTVTIVDDDRPSFTAVNDLTVEENTGASAFVVFHVTLSPPPEGEATINYSTWELTAVPGVDYVAKNGTLVFAPGQTDAEVRVEILGDSIAEPAETFALQLSRAVGMTIQDDRGIATIFDDDDPAPAVAITPVSVIEGNSGVAHAAMTVRLSRSETRTVRLNVATTGTGTASAADYQALDEVVVFEPGQVERTVTVNVVGDTVDENDETFEVAVREGTTVRATANVTIVDDDTPISITVADVTVQEKTGPSATAVFRITLSPAPVTYATFEVETVNGTATAGADYLPLSGTVIFFAGQAQGDVEVDVFGDSLDEPNETFTLRITNAVGANIVDGTATATIVDDDESAPAAVSIAPVSVTEGNSGQQVVDLHVRLGGASTAPLTLNIASNPGSATSSIDYLPISRTITFAPGQTDIVVQATIVGDVIDEQHETFFVTASEGTTLRATGVVTILDDDSAPVFSVADTSVTEKTGTSAFAVFRVTLTPPPAGSASVAYATQNGTALAGADYLAANGVLTFSAGQATREVQVEVFGDAVTEGTETFTLVLPNATATATILDDDVASTTASISVADIEVRESDGTSDATFMLTLSRAMTVPVTVSYSTFEHTATPPRDYEEKSGSVTFAPGETTRPVTVRIAGDREAEPREMFRLRLLSSEGAPIDDGTALCTIVDDDTLTKRRTSRH